MSSGDIDNGLDVKVLPFGWRYLDIGDPENWPPGVSIKQLG
jgi:hypothetical protein